MYVANIATLVCLFWFSTPSALRSRNGLLAVRPTKAFRSFVASVISQTNLPPTALSLALFYIYRLKTTAPRPIMAHANSEYRVFTTALVLANKFLDDNTFTNKSWADMTKLPLNEISAMEIEFLTSLNYKLNLTSTEWDKWQQYDLGSWLKLAHGPGLNAKYSTFTPASGPVPAPALAPVQAAAPTPALAPTPVPAPVPALALTPAPAPAPALVPPVHHSAQPVPVPYSVPVSMAPPVPQLTHYKGGYIPISPAHTPNLKRSRGGDDCAPIKRQKRAMPTPTRPSGTGSGAAGSITPFTPGAAGSGYGPSPAAPAAPPVVAGLGLMPMQPNFLQKFPAHSHHHPTVVLSPESYASPYPYAHKFASAFASHPMLTPSTSPYYPWDPSGIRINF